MGQRSDFTRVEREHHLFDYRDGKLFWKNPTSARVKVGRQAGSLTTNGYFVVSYDKRLRMLHRVIWDMHNELKCEGYLVDHIDGDRANNRIENLRLCDYSQNAANSFGHKDSRIPSKGVSFHRDKYRAQIAHRGKRFHLGLFETEEEARLAYNKKATELYGEYHRQA